MKLAEMLDADNLSRHVAEGTVSEVHHPSEPVRLYNYTQRCQFTGAWDAESRAARGLIVDDEGTVLARPFPKFHNLHEHGPDSAAGALTLTPPLRVFDKVDGSLGISWRRPSDGRIEWATRGSFTSDQAVWANAWWARHGDDDAVGHGTTALVEIVYPENRIVLDYGGRESLTLLAILDNATGVHLAPTFPGDADWWPSDVVDVFDAVDDVAALDRNARPDAEGYVVLSGDGRTRVKLKADEYMRLHKILTGVSTVTVWDLLRSGDSLDVLYDKVPDEFAAWATSTVSDLTTAYDATLAAARAEYDAIAHLLPDRKAFAAEAVKSDNRAVLFRIADDKSLAELVWRMVKPERSVPFTLDDQS